MWITLWSCIELKISVQIFSWKRLWKAFTSCAGWSCVWIGAVYNLEHRKLYPSCTEMWWLTFWHQSFTFNSNKSPTWCNKFSVYYPDVCLQLNMFQAFSRSSSGAQWLQWQPLVLPSYCGDSRAVFVVEPASWLAWPRTQNDYHHYTKVKPEAATAVIELLMMGGKTPKTCWGVNKRQDNKLKNCCIRLVIYLNCAIMHGLTNLKFYI